MGSWLGNLGKNSNLTSNGIKKFERKISGGAVRAGKRFTLFIWNEDMNDIIKIIKSLGNSGVLIDGLTETVKHELEKQEGGFLGALFVLLAASLVQHVISPVAKGIKGRGVRGAGRGYMVKIFYFCAIL